MINQHPRRYPVLMSGSLVLSLLWVGGASAEALKMDEALQFGKGPYPPIFIRMEDQLFKQAGDYEEWCQKQTKGRTALGPEVIRDLKARSDASWKTVENRVWKLEQEGLLRNVQRYWIVNGFACRADRKACEELATLDSVSFIYSQQLRNIPLYRWRPADPKVPENCEAIYEQVLQAWRDDKADPVSVDGIEIPWNLKRIKADQAWIQEKATGKGIVVGLMDSGLLITPSLMRGVWKNPDEEMNGKDDDGNGYVDDLFGYDFSAEHWYALGDNHEVSHGSMCGGIVAGRALNKKKIATGVAPRAKLMMLRGMGFLKAYEYAAEEGADIISMSYMWPGMELGHFRGLYRLAHEQLSACGVTSVGCAGNFAAGPRKQPEGKQIAPPKDIPCIITAAGIVEDGSQPSFSSAGPCWWEDVKFYRDYPKDKPLRKPDVSGCIGGYPVWGRMTDAKRKKWKVVCEEEENIGLVVGPKGNSFSGPHAAGVAALMLSVNPDLHPWEVKRIMEQTCMDLGPEGWDPKYGAGLIDALAAVQAAKRAR